MRYHLFLPQMRMTHDQIVERALAAEAAGFEGVAFMDHLAPPLAVEAPMWEAMQVAGWVLARTSTLRVGHLVLCDALRHPAVLARQVTSLDHASGGRFELGLGWGSVPEELVAFGVGSAEPSARVGRLAETLAILEALWSGEAVTFRGEHFTLTDARQQPPPTGPIPLTIGGSGRRTMELVRRHATWWNLPVHRVDRLEQLRPAAGDARVSVQVMVALLGDGADRGAVAEMVARRYGTGGLGSRVVLGTADEVAGHMDELAGRGVERVHVWFADFAPPSTIDAFSAVIG